MNLKTIAADWKNLAERAAATFVQAAVAVVLANGINGHSVDPATLKTAGIAGLAAVLSLAYNVAKKFINTQPPAA